MPMVTTVELDDLVAASETARQSNARHGRFGAAVDHADFFDRRHPLADQLGEFDLERIGNSKTQPARRGVADKIDNYFRSVSENSWTPTADVVDVLVVIDIPNLRSFRAR